MIQTIAYIWRENFLGFLSADIICSENRIKQLEKLSFDEQIMSTGKQQNIFPHQIEAIVFIILQISTRAVFGIFGIFSHVARLDRSRVSENIWFIIGSVISLIVVVQASVTVKDGAVLTFSPKHLITSFLKGNIKRKSEEQSDRENEEKKEFDPRMKSQFIVRTTSRLNVIYGLNSSKQYLTKQ